MTSAQLARRLGVSQPRVLAIEKAEATGSIKLESLEREALIHAKLTRIIVESHLLVKITKG